MKKTFFFLIIIAALTISHDISAQNTNIEYQTFAPFVLNIINKPYDTLAEEIQKNTGINKEIIFHIIKKESGGNEKAVSYKGARGLTQTLPIIIKEIINEKIKAGKRKEIQKKLLQLLKEIKLFKQKQFLSTNDRKNLEYKKKNFLILKALLLLPDIPHKRNAEELYNLAINNGKINLIFGMIHLAKYKAIINYYKSISVIDSNTETLLAAQLAYNCGITRLKERIQNLGEWSNIFDTPNNKKNYLPNETANYGYIFIRDFAQQQKGKYKTHPVLQKHYKIIFTALSRSKTYKTTIKTLNKYRLYKKSYLLSSQLKKIIRKANNCKLQKKDIVSLKKEMMSLPPRWPLIREMINYINNTCLSD